MSNILDTIDNALTDWETSNDAMRWTTDADAIHKARSPSLDLSGFLASLSASVRQFNETMRQIAAAMNRNFSAVLECTRANASQDAKQRRRHRGRCRRCNPTANPTPAPINLHDYQIRRRNRRKRKKR